MMSRLDRARIVAVATPVLMVLLLALYPWVAPNRYEVYVSPFQAEAGLRAVQLTILVPSFQIGHGGFSRYRREIFTVRYQPGGVETTFVDAQIERHGAPASSHTSGKVRISAVRGSADARLRVEIMISGVMDAELSHDYIITNERPVAPHGWAVAAESD